MSKYEPLWKHLQMDGSVLVTFTFEELKDILGFEPDHSFLAYKKEAVRFGYTVFGISMKKKYIQFIKSGWVGTCLASRLPW